MTIDELIERQRSALETGDTEGAQQLLDEIEAHIEAKNAWKWLRNNAPESYEQLIDKLGQAKTTLAAPGRTEMKQLAEVFGCCRDNGVQLASLAVSENLHKYREAVAYLYDMVGGKEPKDVDTAELIQTLDRIKQENRDQVRAWARKPRRL
jgi:hypothetical protein